ncbi:TonB family protein [Chitinimonas sp.]|uniref:energy transducer TonB n=1 Tax=Chitinimonas sp. TaxID=1934313 RepID=UPI0035AE5529
MSALRLPVTHSHLARFAPSLLIAALHLLAAAYWLGGNPVQAPVPLPVMQASLLPPVQEAAPQPLPQAEARPQAIARTVPQARSSQPAQPRTLLPAVPASMAAVPAAAAAPSAPAAAAPAEAEPAVAAPSKPAAGKSAELTPPRSDAQGLNNPKPPYPAMSRRLHEEGVVQVEVHVLADGKVDQVRLKRSSGFERLDRAALDTLQRWTFIPARQGDTPLALWYVVPVDFSLNS